MDCAEISINTSPIVANLRIINDDCNDLGELEHKTSAIVSNLRDMRRAGEQAGRGERARH